jgi:hypothetical protein
MRSAHACESTFAHLARHPRRVPRSTTIRPSHASHATDSSTSLACQPGAAFMDDRAHRKSADARRLHNRVLSPCFGSIRLLAPSADLVAMPQQGVRSGRNLTSLRLRWVVIRQRLVVVAPRSRGRAAGASRIPQTHETPPELSGGARKVLWRRPTLPGVL